MVNNVNCICHYFGLTKSGADLWCRPSYAILWQICKANKKIDTEVLFILLQINYI